MPPFEAIGRLLLVLGLVIAGLGLVILIFGRLPMIGRLPGDIVIQRDNTTIWIPIVSGLVVSLILSLVLTVLFRLWQR